MAVTPLKITCRIEELPTIGKMLLDTLSPNLTDFTAFSPDFSATYLTNGTTKLNAVTALISPKQLTAEMKIITQRIYTNMDNLRPKLDYLEGYVKRATGLTISAKDFGISKVRQKNNKGDVEGLVDTLGFLLTNVTNNMAALTAKGYTAAQHTALTGIKTSLTNDSSAQNTKLNDRNNKVVSNHNLINEFWAICTDISDAGKRIYKSTAPQKLGDFAIAELKRRIRNEQKKNKFDGLCSFEGKPLANAKIELIPVLSGRRRTTKTDAKGAFVIKSLTEGDYIANVIADGKQTESTDVKIETGKAVAKNFVMKRALDVFIDSTHNK